MASLAAVGNGGSGDGSSATEMENPCWQDFYDEDCETNFAAASFVASKWIKSMPCGAGIEVCAAFFYWLPVAASEGLALITRHPKSRCSKLTLL
jgi:hypothetical protein